MNSEMRTAVPLKITVYSALLKVCICVVTYFQGLTLERVLQDDVFEHKNINLPATSADVGSHEGTRYRVSIFALSPLHKVPDGAVVAVSPSELRLHRLSQSAVVWQRTSTFTHTRTRQTNTHAHAHCRVNNRCPGKHQLSLHTSG